MAEFKYKTVINEIIGQIECGQLSGKLMSVRKLAKLKQLGVSTVVQAYHELEHLGWITAMPKQGYFVTSRQQKIQPNYGLQVNRVVAGISLNKAVQFSFNDSTILPLSCTAPSTVIDNELLLNQLHKKSLSKRPYRLLMQDPIEGLPELREQISKHLASSGQMLNPNQILVSNGRKDALMIALTATKALTGPIAVESPMSFYFQAILQQLNADVIEIPVQSNYQEELALLSSTYKDQVFTTYLVNPNFADPTGRVLSRIEKCQLIDWAVQHNVTLIEYDRGELYFGSQRPMTLASLVAEKQCRVVSIGDFYDTISPTISLGYLLCINTFDECQFAKQTLAEEPSLALQYMLYEMMASGRYNQLLGQLRRKMLLNYTSTMAILTPHLNKFLRDKLYISQPSGGPCLWFQLPANLSSQVLWDRVIEKKLSIAPGTMFSMNGHYDHYFRITFALPWNDTMATGISLLGEVIAAYIESVEAGG